MNAVLRGKPDAGNQHVRFDEKPRRGSLLDKITRNDKTGEERASACLRIGSDGKGGIHFPLVGGELYEYAFDLRGTGAREFLLSLWCFTFDLDRKTGTFGAFRPPAWGRGDESDPRVVLANYRRWAAAAGVRAFHPAECHEKCQRADVVASHLKMRAEVTAWAEVHPGYAIKSHESA